MSAMITKPIRSLATLLLGAALITGCGAPADESAEGEPAAESAPKDVVFLDSTALSLAGIVVDSVVASGGSQLSVTGTITYDANLVSHIGPHTSGRISRLLADLGQQVQTGQPLAVLESPEIGQIRAELRESEALVRIANENFERQRRLQEQGISSRREVLEAEAELRRAEAAQTSARERLAALGAGEGQGASFTLTAPFTGVVVERDASLGEMASPEDHLFTIADLNRLWIELDIYERDLASIRRGDRVEVTSGVYPDRVFPGVIAYLGDILDPAKRTIRARVEVPNPDRALRPGMFATARIQLAGSGAVTMLVPQVAVQEMNGRSVVFVPGARPGEFRVQPVEVGETDEQGRVAILAGLQPGDRIVVAGAFTLRSELSKGELAEEEP